tara:strand:+ start:2516 stop:3115 length:600 start_codon:yes stop_codon:yes gene_type:complete
MNYDYGKIEIKDLGAEFIRENISKRTCIEQKIVLNHSIEYCWDIITKEKHLELFHPFILRHNGNRLLKNGDKDTITYLNNFSFTREVVYIYNSKKNEEHNSSLYGYDLLVGRNRKSFVQWILSDNGNLSSTLTIIIYPHTIDSYSKIYKFFILNFYLRPQLKKYLKSVTCGLKFYLETGENVNKNQFGIHKWFSINYDK